MDSLRRTLKSLKQRIWDWLAKSDFKGSCSRLILSGRTMTTKWMWTSASCVAWRWKMSSTSLAFVKCLHRKNTSTAVIKWPLLYIGPCIGRIDLMSMCNGTATNQRMWLSIIKSRYCGILISKQTVFWRQPTRHHNCWQINKEMHPHWHSSSQ